MDKATRGKWDTSPPPTSRGRRRGLAFTPPSDVQVTVQWWGLIGWQVGVGLPRKEQATACLPSGPWGWTMWKKRHSRNVVAPVTELPSKFLHRQHGPVTRDGREHSKERGEQALYPRPRRLGLSETPWKQAMQVCECGAMALSSPLLKKIHHMSSSDSAGSAADKTHAELDLTKPGEATKRHEAAEAITDARSKLLTRLRGPGRRNIAGGHEQGVALEYISKVR